MEKRVSFWARIPIKVPTKTTFVKSDGTKITFYKKGLNRIIKFAPAIQDEQ